MNPQKQLISVLMENEPGALSRVVGLFSQRGYNIESLNVAPTEDNTLSRLTLCTTAPRSELEQITKHLHKLVDVVKVLELSESSHIERELMLVKTRATGNLRGEIHRITEIFRGQIVDVGQSLFVIQIVGDSEKLDAFIRAIGEGNIVEVVRSGVSGISRGEKILAV